MRPGIIAMFLTASLFVSFSTDATAQVAKTPPVTIVGDHFLRDGKPYQILSGAIHYARVPREDWRDRLQKARAMGLNTVETYVFWNLHEPKPGVFDFSGQLDIAEFVRIAQQEGLNVIVRPGPYVCAEWEAGGYPAWLFADPSMKVRTQDPKFLAAADRYLARVGKELAPLQVNNGGPIIAVQIENEYGSFGSDRVYMEDIHQSLIRAGFGPAGGALFYTSDGADELHNDVLPNILAVINFGPGEAKGEFAKLLKFRPEGQGFSGPRMTGEYWDGWFDAYGDNQHVHTDSEQQAREIEWILDQGYSFNLYMFHGGTSFGFMNGANFQGGPNDHYSPQTTSYDYDAALDEAGRPTKKFYLLRDVIQKHTGVPPPPLPAPQPFIAIPEFPLTETASIWSNLPKATASETPRPMETVGQACGYILYRTELSGPQSGELAIDELRDYAAIYINQKFVATRDHRLAEKPLQLTIPAGHATLDILVENTGRVNFGPHLQDGRAGITDSVTLAGKKLTGWKIYPLPMHSPEGIGHWQPATGSGPAFHRGSFTINTAGNTFLDIEKLGKGFVWVNGHNLGRVWNIGPQRSLFLPASWLKIGRNEVVVFDYTDLPAVSLRGVIDPIWPPVTRQ
jgi:beta-galactosidase